MTKHLKHLKTFEFHSIIMCPEALFGCVAHIAASKINVKVDWSSHQFSQNFYNLVKHGFSCTNVCHVPRDMLKTEGKIPGVYRGNLISISQSFMDEVLRLSSLSCARTSADDNARICLARISKISFIRTICCEH